MLLQCTKQYNLKKDVCVKWWPTGVRSWQGIRWPSYEQEIISNWHIKLWHKQNCVLKTCPPKHRGQCEMSMATVLGIGPPTSFSFSCRTRTISPGSTPGAWSASPPKVIFWPCFMPLSTCTSRIFTSFTTFLPSHFLQRSFSLITSPEVG